MRLIIYRLLQIRDTGHHKIKFLFKIIKSKTTLQQIKLTHLIKYYWWVVWLTKCEGITLSTGLLSKKLVGRSSNPPLRVGIIGKSSWQGTWWKPIVYHSTMSLFSIFLFLHYYHTKLSPIKQNVYSMYE